MRRIDLPRTELEEFAKQGLGISEVARYYGIDVAVVRRHLKQFGIILPRKKPDRINIVDPYPFINKQWLVDNYLNTSKSLRVLAQEVGCTKGTLESRVSKYGLSKRYKYQFNRDKLFNLTDPIVYYLAGLLATDGWVEQSHNTICLSLCGEDEYNLLTKLQQYFELTRPVVKYTHSYYWQLDGKGVKEFFEEHFKITPAKTFTLQFPGNFYSEDCAKMFVRGCFDGDGCISPYGRGDFLCASKDFITGLKNLINVYTGLNFNICTETRKKTNSVYYAFYTGKKKGRILFDWMYEGFPEFRLQRKYERFENSL